MSWPSGLRSRPDELACPAGTRLNFAYAGVPWWIHASFEGEQSLSVQRGWSELHVEVPSGTPEGKRTLLLSFGGLRPQSYRIPVSIDNTPPLLQLVQPAAERSLPADHCKLSGRAEPGCRIQLGGDEGQTVVADAQGRFQLSCALKPGWNTLALSAADAAGNRSKLQRRVFSDREAPRFTLERLAPDGEATPLRGKDSPKDSFRVRLLASDDGGVDRARYRLDQGKWTTLSLEPDQGAWRALFPLRDLAEGSRSLQVEIVDRAGRKTAEDVEFLVDSTEVLGKKMVTRGARGEDVRQLQQRLAEAGALAPELVSGDFDEATEQAVRRFQELEGLPATGRVAQLTLAALGPRLLVNLGRFELILDRPGQPLKRYTIACGSSEFPTPTGRFVVYEKVSNPSWIPPDSPWAKEAKTIPPGPDNPLGTRWIGLDWGNVGIHGTNADWTIGSASSHGCLRMHLSDVEELYDLVNTSMPVTIYGGWEQDALRRRYWPD